MKIDKLIIIFITCILFSYSTLLAQEKKWAFEFRTAINSSDANYGTEGLRSFLPVDDYPLYSNGGDGALGYSIGIGVGYPFGKHFELVTNIDYIRYNYDASTGVFITSSSGPPTTIRPDVPIFFAGKVGYNYFNIETGIRYSFNKDLQKGLFVGLSFSDMIHLNTDWTLDVKYEDQTIERGVDFSDNQGDLEYNNLFFIVSQVGYHYKIKERFTIAPIFSFRYGLTPVVESEEDILNISALQFGVQVRRWF